MLVAKSIIIKFKKSGDVLWSVDTVNGAFRSVLEVSKDNLAIAGSIIANNLNQAYVAVVSGNDGNSIVWDNTALEGPSSFAQVFMDPRDGGVVFTGGYAPLNIQNSEIIFAAYKPVKKLSDEA